MTSQETHDLSGVKRENHVESSTFNLHVCTKNSWNIMYTVHNSSVIFINPFPPHPSHWVNVFLLCKFCHIVSSNNSYWRDKYQCSAHATQRFSEWIWYGNGDCDSAVQSIVSAIPTSTSLSLIPTLQKLQVRRHETRHDLVNEPWGGSSALVFWYYFYSISLHVLANTLLFQYSIRIQSPKAKVSGAASVEKELRASSAAEHWALRFNAKPLS